MPGVNLKLSKLNHFIDRGREKLRLYRRYGSSHSGFFFYILKNLWINCLRKEQIFRWTDRLLWIAHRNFQSSKNPWYYGITEKVEFELLSEKLNPGDAFYDIGANTGIYSHYLAAHKNVYCVQFEPDGDSQKLSRRIAELNHLQKNHMFLPVALGNREGQVDFSTQLGINNRISSGGKTKKVEIRKLDQLNDLPPPAAVKIDAEGSEVEILQGAISTLGYEKLKLVILEFHQGNFDGCHAILTKAGFKLWRGTQSHPFISNSGNLIYIRT